MAVALNGTKLPTLDSITHKVFEGMTAEGEAPKSAGETSRRAGRARTRQAARGRTYNVYRRAVSNNCTTTVLTAPIFPFFDVIKSGLEKLMVKYGTIADQFLAFCAAHSRLL
jgi:hypothetical protein